MTGPLGGKPRYEVRPGANSSWLIRDTEYDMATMDAPRDRTEADRICAALNREYQRWLTDRFYDRAETA